MKLFPVLVIALLVVVLTIDAKPVGTKSKAETASNQVGSDSVAQGKKPSKAKGTGHAGSTKPKKGNKGSSKGKTGSTATNAKTSGTNMPEAISQEPIPVAPVPETGLFSQNTPVESLPAFPQFNYHQFVGGNPLQGLAFDQTIGEMSLGSSFPGQGNPFVLGGGNPSPPNGGLVWVPGSDIGQELAFGGNSGSNLKAF